MKHNIELFVGERAENLAVVYLSRSRNLAIERMTSDYGLDMLVTILRDDTLPTGRVFGVQVKAQDGVIKDAWEEISLNLSQQERNYLKELPFPVCALFFTMDDDQGYYKWLRYPTENKTNLYSLAQAAWRSLETLPIEQLIVEVNIWYDEQRHSAA
ncbi:MAG: DUF4365 domain-containing protein [Cyanobacteria bacterium P01_G01_bin.54]